jgi:myo-inositol-1(or 4)-monophosphatase
VNDTELALAAAQAGAQVVGARYGSALTRIEKSPVDFATDADVEAEQAIRELIGTARPADGFVGEEAGASGPSSAPRSWLVDPLCGTLNYAAQTPLVAVNVALREAGRIAVAAVADPFAGEVFWTDGIRSYLRRGLTDVPLLPTAASALVDVNLDPPFPNAATFRAVHLLAEPGFAEAFRPRVSSTTLALAWVAAGRRAAYVTDGELRDSVHFAAGIALCEAAGCLVTDLRGEPVHSGAGGLIAAADEQTHTTLLELITHPTAPIRR